MVATLTAIFTMQTFCTGDGKTGGKKKHKVYREREANLAEQSHVGNVYSSGSGHIPMGSQC